MDHATREVMDPAIDDMAGVVEQVLGTNEPEPARPRMVSPALAMARAAAEKAEQEPKRRAWGHDALMLVRRSHLYAGLLLYPWVLLYGITAFLFNHPLVFPDQTIIPFGKEALKDTPFASLPRPADLAARVIAAINERTPEGEAKYAMIKPEAARFERGGVGATVQDGAGKSYSVSFEGDGGLIRGINPNAAQTKGEGGPQAKGEGGPQAKGGRGRGENGPEGEGGPQTKGAQRKGRGEGGGPEGEGGPRRGEGGPAPAPFAATGVKVDGLPLDAIREALPTVLERAGLESPKVNEVRVAGLSFQMQREGDEKPWQVTYNAQTGAISGRSMDAQAVAADLSTRRFLLRLHTIHGYPSEFGERWIWALLVDVMAGLMVFWGISGIVMWWQIKRTRKIGAAALLLSTAAAAWIGIGMHAYMIGGGR